MRTEKMLAALLAGLIILSLTGCGADKAENTSSDPATTESGIAATLTESTAEPTAESSLPAGTESTTKSTAEKERAGSTAPADSGKKETAKPADADRRLHRQSRPNRRKSQNRRKASPTKLRSLLILHQPKLQNRSLPVHSLI